MTEHSGTRRRKNQRRQAALMSSASEAELMRLLRQAILEYGVAVADYVGDLRRCLPSSLKWEGAFRHALACV